MSMRSKQINIGIITLILILALIFSLGISRIPAALLISLVLASIVFLLAFTHTDFALILLIFFMLLSPELKVGAIGGRDVVFRIDDIFLIIVFLGWLARMAINKELGLLKTTPVNRPILIYILICIVATFFGILRGYAKLQVSIFYLLKYFEYFLLFFMVTNSLKNYKQIKVFIFSILLVAFIISVYAVILHFRGMARVTAPFEGKVGEANTLGGYLILIITLVTALFLNVPSLKLKLFLVAILLFAFPALLFTLSRGSWFAFIPAFIALIVFTPKGKVFLLIAVLSIILFSSIILPKFFFERLNYTFTPGREYKIFGKHITLEESAAARINIIKFALEKWTHEPVLGYGVGSSQSVIDNQYARIIIESGIAGLIAFLWIIIDIVINCLRNLAKLKDDKFATGITAGFLAGFFGLLIHALGAETFIIIRIMEPFWFLTAIVVMLPEFYKNSKEFTPNA